MISVGFAKLADFAQHLFTRVTTAGDWTYLLPLLLAPIGFGLSAFLSTRCFPNAQGSGIPQAIAARHLKEDEDRGRLLSLRIAFGKILLTCPSSNDLRLFGLWKSGFSGSVCGLS